MSDTSPSAANTEGSTPPDEPARSRGSSATVDDSDSRSLADKLKVVAIAVVAIAVTGAIAAALIPRWWAQQIGSVVDGRLTVGSFLGIAVGAIFTVLPLVVVWLGWRFRGGWTRALVFAILAAIVALPNLATLGIVIGAGSGAHAGERILDVEGPGFRSGTLIGALIGLALFAGIAYLSWSRGRAKRKKDEALAAKASGRPS